MELSLLQSSLWQLLSLCVGSSELGTGAADGFQILMVDTEYMLNLKCHANVRVSTPETLCMYESVSLFSHCCT